MKNYFINFLKFAIVSIVVWVLFFVQVDLARAGEVVSFIGTSNLIATDGTAPGAITPHASTLPGDLLIFYHYSRSPGGDETVTLPANFNTVFNAVTTSGLVAVGWKISAIGDTTYTAQGVTNHATGNSGDSITEFIETYRGVDPTNPIVKFTASNSTWTSSTNVGAIAAPGTATVDNGDMVVVFGGRFENITAQTVLTGDNLTWATRTLNNNSNGTDNGSITQNGLNSSGSQQTVTAKTIATTGTAQIGSGRMFIIEKAPTGSCSSAGTGPWATGGTWGAGCNGVSGTPGVNDAVTILNTHNVTVASGVAAFAANLTINSGGTLTITSTGTLTNYGNFTNSSGGTVTGTGALNLNGSSATIDGSGSMTGLTGLTTITNSKTINATASFSLGGALTVASGTVTNNGTISVAGTMTATGNWTQGTDSTLNVSGSGANAIAGAGTLTATASGNTVNYNLNGAQTCKVVTYLNLTLSGGGTKTCAITAATNVTVNNGAGSTIWTGTSSPTIGGTLSIGSGAKYTVGAFTIAVTGLTTVDGTLEINSSTGTKTFGNMTVGGTLSFITQAETVDITDLTVSNGGTITHSVAEIVNINGNFVVNGTGSVTGTTGLWTFKRVGGGTISGTSTSVSLTSATFTTAYTNTIVGLTVGTLTPTQTVTNQGTITVSTSLATGTFVNDTNATVNFTSGVTGTLTATAAGNTVNYNGGAQTAKVTTYVNLTLSGSGAKTFGTTPTVNGILSMEGIATVVVTTGVVTYGANATLKYNTTTGRTVTSEEWITPFAATGGVIIASTGTITANEAKVFNSTAPLTIESGASLAMSTFLLTLNGNLVNNGGTTSGSGGVTIAGTATQSIGSFTTTGTVTMTKTALTATLTGAVNGGALTINGTGGTLGAGAGLTHTFTGDVTLTAGTLNGGSSTIKTTSVSATAWGGNGALYTASTGTVEFGAAGAQTHSASATTFYNLKLSGSNVKTLTNISTVGGTFVLNGTATATTAANLVVTGLTTVGTGTTLTQGATYNFTTGGLTVESTGIFSNTGTGDFTLGGDVSNAGAITIDSSGGTHCDENAEAIIITSTAGTRTWSGAGTFTIEDVDVTGQSASGITITAYSSTSHSSNTGWDFADCVRTLTQAAYKLYENIDGTAFGTDGVVTGASGSEVAFGVARDATYMYVVGSDATVNWRIEKRSLATGVLDDGFGTSGVIISDNVTDVAQGIAIDSTYMYVVGYQGFDWRIEKRLLSTGALDNNFDGDGVVVGASASLYARAIAIDSTYMYVVGSDNNALRIEKRLLTTGAVDNGFGTSGIITSSTAGAEAFAIAINSTYMFVAGTDANYDWRIEKRLLTTGAVDNNFDTDGIITITTAIQANGIAIDSTYMYVAGYNDSVDWRIEKRLLTTGAVDNGFGVSGIVTSAAESHGMNAVVIDSTYIYTVGNTATTDWRIEKHLLTTGAPDNNFGTSGVIVGDATSQVAYAITIDTTSMYVLGNDSAPDLRIEKRLLTTGASFSTDTAPTTPLAATNTAATLAETGDAFRLRMLVARDDLDLTQNSPSLKLQYSAKVGTCDASFTGEDYADVTTSTPISYYDNSSISDGDTATAIPTFGTSGVISGDVASNYAYASAKDSTYMYIVGYDSSSNFRIEKRLLTTGALDNGFGTSGVISGDAASQYAYGIAIDATYMYVAGYNSSNNFRIEKRLLTTGAVDNGFGTSGVVSGDAASNIAYAIAIDSTYMYIVGDDNSNWRIEKRLLTTGAVDNGFGTSGVITSDNASSVAYAIAIDSTYMYVGGSDGNSDWRIEKRLLTTGAVDNGFGTSGVITGAAASASITAIAIDATYMYAAGYDSNIDWRIEKRLLTTGAVDNDFGTAGVITGDAAGNAAQAIAIDSTYMYVAGHDVSSNWRTEKRLLTTGAVDNNFGTSGVIEGVAASQYAYAIVIDSIYMYIAGYDSSGNWRIEKRELVSGDPAIELINGARTVVYQTYEEANNFTNSIAAVPGGQDGLWDFALYDNGAPGSTSYCLRAVYLTGNLDAYTVIPEIITKASAALSVYGYRWRNDNADEITASYAVDENTPLTSGVYIGSVRRLRMLVSNTGAGSASDRLYRLEYASGACDASWTQVPGVGDESKPWVMSASGFINNASATTDLSGLSNPAGKTFVAGVAMTTASQTAAHTLANSKFTELEYSIAATSNVVTNTTYCFRLTHAGSTTGFTYSQVPQIVAISQVFRSRTGGGGGVEAPSSAPDDQVGGAVGGGGGVGGVEGGGGGSIASGTAVLQSGAVSSVNIGSGGSGYASPPSVSFCSGGGNSAAGTAVMEGGSVSSVNITNGGSGYSSAPVVVFGGSCGGAGGGDDGGDSGFLFDVQSNFASVADIPISEILNFFASLFNFNKWEKI